MVPRDPTLSALLLVQHILSMLFVFSSVKHKTVLHDKGIAVLYDSYSTASSFDPPTQNPIMVYVLV